MQRVTEVRCEVIVGFNVGQIEQLSLVVACTGRARAVGIGNLRHCRRQGAGIDGDPIVALGDAGEQVIGLGKHRFEQILVRGYPNQFVAKGVIEHHIDAVEPFLVFWHPVIVKIQPDIVAKDDGTETAEGHAGIDIGPHLARGQTDLGNAGDGIGVAVSGTA